MGYVSPVVSWQQCESGFGAACRCMVVVCSEQSLWLGEVLDRGWTAPDTVICDTGRTW